jgi:hypothetical protein
LWLNWPFGIKERRFETAGFPVGDFKSALLEALAVFRRLSTKDDP